MGDILTMSTSNWSEDSNGGLYKQYIPLAYRNPSRNTNADGW